MKTLCVNCGEESNVLVCKKCQEDQIRLENSLREDREALEFEMEYGAPSEWDDWAGYLAIS